MLPVTRPRRASGSSSATRRTTLSTRNAPATRPVGSSTAPARRPHGTPDDPRRPPFLYRSQRLSPGPKRLGRRRTLKIAQLGAGVRPRDPLLRHRGPPATQLSNGVFGDAGEIDARGLVLGFTKSRGPTVRGRRSEPSSTSRATWSRRSTSTSSGRATRRKEGYARVTARYDEPGNKVEQARLLDESGRATRHKDWLTPSGTAKVPRAGQPDGTGLLRRGRQAHPAQRTASPSGLPSTTSEATRLSEPTSTSRAGPPGHSWPAEAHRPLRRAGQPARQTADFDEQGRPDPAQERLRQADRTRYDERGNVSRGRSTSTSRAGPPGVKDGFARFTARYDERGNRTEMGLLRRGRPAHPAHTDGFAQLVTARYDERRQRGRGGLLRRVRPGHPAQGRLRQVRLPRTTSGATRPNAAYFDEAGKPTRHKDGYRQAHRPLRRAGQAPGRASLLRRSRAGPPGIKSGFARWTAKYDERGNAIEWAYFGVDGRSVPSRTRTATPSSARNTASAAMRS